MPPAPIGADGLTHDDDCEDGHSQAVTFVVSNVTMRAPTTPEPSLAVAGLKILDLDDYDRFKAAVVTGRQIGWGYFFPYLLTHNRPGRSAMLVGEDDGAICLFRCQIKNSRRRLELYTPPVPLSVQALRRCLERANDFNGDRSARVLRIDAKDAEAMAGVPGLETVVRRMQYVFAPKHYENLGGSSFRTIRRHIASLERRSEVEVAAFSPAHVEGCRELLQRWRLAYRETNEKGGGGTRISRTTLELAETRPGLDLRGEVVLLDGRVVAFALGGEIRPGWACSFERKADNSFQGLAYFHFHSFLLSLRGFERVNDGSDAGREGLRQFKDTFRPLEMHAEYRATQRA